MKAYISQNYFCLACGYMLEYRLNPTTQQITLLHPDREICEQSGKWLEVPELELNELRSVG